MTRDISRKLCTAITEAIQDHADQFNGGKIDLTEVVAALRDVGSDFLSAIPDPDDRALMHRSLCREMALAAQVKAARHGELAELRQ